MRTSVGIGSFFVCSEVTHLSETQHWKPRKIRCSPNCCYSFELVGFHTIISLQGFFPIGSSARLGADHDAQNAKAVEVFPLVDCGIQRFSFDACTAGSR